MADRPGSYRTGSVSRNTIVMRRAKDEDARRIAERDEALSRSTGETRVLSVRRTAPPQSARDAAEASRRIGDSRISQRERTVSGRTVVIRKEGQIAGKVVSTRLSGRHAASVRIAGGDTIIRYQSGDMVIKRGARRASLRRQLVWAYALGYLLLFGTYVYFLLTGTYTMTPEEFVHKAFSRRHSSSVMDLEMAALEAMRGNRTPAEVRLAGTIQFYDDNKEPVRIESGGRLTLVNAAKLGRAILSEQDRPPEQRTFEKPLVLYKETYITNINWPHLLTLYNSLGFFLLLGLFLWRPLMSYLGTQGKKTAAALRNAKTAQEEAEEYRDKYRALAADIEDRGDRLRAEAEAEAEAEREAALARARTEAADLAGDMTRALENEMRELASRLGQTAALEACDRAQALLSSRLGQAEHDAAVDELIADITAMRPGG